MQDTFVIRKEGDGLVVFVSGELDLVLETDLVKCVDEVIQGADSHRCVVLDLSGVSFIDSSGMRALLICQEHALQHQSEMRLTKLSVPVRRLLDLAGVVDWFTVE